MFLDFLWARNSLQRGRLRLYSWKSNSRQAFSYAFFLLMSLAPALRDTCES